MQSVFTALFLVLALFSSTVSATLILETYGSGTPTPGTIGGYTMTDFSVVNDTLTGTTSVVDSPLGGQLTFRNISGSALQMTRSLADSTSWWNNGESSDYDIFTTGVSWIEILLPVNTRAISFNVGADLNSTRNNAWLAASETTGSGLDNYRFNVSRINTPGFGIYTANTTAGQCSALTSVVIDPDFWGVGNFSINQDPCTASVPEPSTAALLGTGMLGLLLARRRARV